LGTAVGDVVIMYRYKDGNGYLIAMLLQWALLHLNQIHIRKFNAECGLLAQENKLAVTAAEFSLFYPTMNQY
jgi:hypothetical protein